MSVNKMRLPPHPYDEDCLCIDCVRVWAVNVNGYRLNRQYAGYGWWIDPMIEP